MTTPKKPPPNLAAAVEKDLTSDLKKVGGFFRGLMGFTEKAERVIKAATEEHPNHPPESASPPRALGRGQSDIVVEARSCDVCGGDGVVGNSRKVPCPMCSKSR